MTSPVVETHRILLGWKVSNIGTGAGITDEWVDRIIASNDETIGDNDDIILAEFTHNGLFNKDEFYNLNKDILLPRNLEGRYNLYVQTGIKSSNSETIFENGFTENNINSAQNKFFVAPKEYADLIVTNINADTTTAQTGETISLEWTVANQGLTVLETVLAPGVAGKYVIIQTDTYNYVWEGIYEDNNEKNSDINIIRSTPSDLKVVDINVLPKEDKNYSGDKTTIEWTVRNDGADVRSGTRYWYDEIWISDKAEFNSAGANQRKIGFVAYSPENGLGTGESYTQQADVVLPVGWDGEYYIYVSTDYSYQQSTKKFRGEIPVRGDNNSTRESFEYQVYEKTDNNLGSKEIDITYREADLKISKVEVSNNAPQSGEEILVAARNLSTGDVQRYGYTNEVRSKKEEVRSNDSTTYLTIVSGNLGSGGESIAYGTTPQITDIQSDLGGVVQWNGTTINGEDGEGVARYTFGLREGEIQSTATGIVLVGAEVTGGGLPSIAGLTPVATNTDGNYALFAIHNPGLNLISLTPSLSPSLTLRLAGDVNNDGAVDGADSELVNTAIALGNYVVDYDFNRDNVVNASDMQILGSNYGFTANRAPIVIADEVLTHTDLETFIELDTLATDAEGDEIYFRLANPEQGDISFTPDGKFARFTPNAGYSGDASFELIADDGYSRMSLR